MVKISVKPDSLKYADEAVASVNFINTEIQTRKDLCMLTLIVKGCIG